MTKIKKHRGFTVVEVMIFSVVGLMFLTLLAQVFIMASKRTEDSRLRVDIQQSAMVVLKILERDLNKTSAKAMAAVDNSDAYVLALTRLQGWNNNSDVTWNKEQVVYGFDKTKGSLYRGYYSQESDATPKTSPKYSDELVDTRPYLPTDTELMNVFNSNTGKIRKLSPYVEEFWISDRKDQKTLFQSQPLMLRLKVRRPLSTSERFAEFTIDRFYTLRNSF
ncbi:MAG TPA: hypothetical protein EYO33_06175 [Phycisphaerales bacterium]|nr:hypothetical protein [Phycisphaerales bacterium]